MKRHLIAILFAVFPVLALASEGGPLFKANIDVSDKQSLQRGARLFVNYCLSCHSARFQRYNRMARDLGLSDSQVIQNLMFAADKIYEHMTVAMPREEAKEWFGAPPPDLTLIARRRGPDWLYTYLLTFYEDDKRPFGVNNWRFPNVSMPHVLWELQGIQKPVYKTEKDAEGHEHMVIERLQLVKKGKLTPEQYQSAVRDLVAFLAYMGEPVQLERQRIGFWVLLYLVVFAVLSYLLKKEYWKDVH
ncbi:MAG: cytochrome c1 [Gammaproteobacteria bacterium]|nr:MAG: cytochrome c1 [Gammaproteobacteria bacterium]